MSANSIYTVSPDSYGADGTLHTEFRRLVEEAAGATEQAGWTGMLVPQNFHEIDPLLVAAHLGAVTERLIPLIAFSRRRCRRTPPRRAPSRFAALYDRPLYFNLVARCSGRRAVAGRRSALT